jgi:hypothetical protein
MAEMLPQRQCSDRHERDGVMVTVAVGDEAELQLVRDPRTTMDPIKLEKLTREVLSITRTSFGNDQITERQVAQAAIDVPYGAFIHRAGELVGTTSARVLSLEDSPVLYLGGAVLVPHVQGHGYYQALLLTRFAIGAVAGATHFTTRTQSPIVCRTLKAHDPYPFTRGTEHYRTIAKQIARALNAPTTDPAFGHGPHTTARRSGLSFDEKTGVVHEAYGRSLYSKLPWSGDPDIDGYIKTHLSIQRGDALIVLGPLRRAELDERCRRKLGLRFDDLMARVTPLVHI